ncbi:MAG: hypothetical protein QG574_4262 [Cyanobacteriota bacterium erpe_2018_sw_21hr_WHONDRS-SW48-000092_B_bin.40]|nr:hypothetical protein [Cyanobacteriota bacterium erpe_2018_sw_21hr_WHONDRS-SW48-000092_B_bin.40]
MSDCRSGRCSDRQVIPQAQVWQHEIPMVSPCSGGSCSPRSFDRMPTRTLDMPPAPYGRSCDGGVCQPSDARALVLKPFDKSQHENNIKNNFDFTDGDYSKALAKAAREGKPLVVVFASDRTPGAMNSVDSVKSAQNSRVGNEGWPVKGNAVFVYVDSDKAANTPELRDLMNQKGISGDRARTIVYNAEMGTDGKVKAVATALNNDRSDFSGAQLAADIHSAKAYSRPLNVPEGKDAKDAFLKPQEATPAPADRTGDKSTHSQKLETKLAEQAQELEKMKQELVALRLELLEARKNSGRPRWPDNEPDFYPPRARPLSPLRPIDDIVKPLGPQLKPHDVLVKPPTLGPIPPEVVPNPKTRDGKPVEPDSNKPGINKPEVKKPGAQVEAPPTAKAPEAPKVPQSPKGIDLLKPDAKPKEVDQPNQFEDKRNQIRAAFNNFSESEDRRLNGAVATMKDDHPTATAEKTKWLRQQEDMNLLADGDIREKLNNLGTYWTGSGRRADEDALVEKRAQQWQDLRYQAANPGDPNHKAKQFMLYEFMTGKHTDGFNFGTENDYRVGHGGSALKTDREEWQKQAAKALVEVIKKPGVEHELAARLIIDGLNNPKVPVSARVELLAGIEHMAADTKNKYLDGHPGPTAVAVVVRSLLKSHNEKEDNGDFQRAAMDKLVKMNAEAAYGVIEYLAREGGSDRTRQHARDLISKVSAKSGK